MMIFNEIAGHFKVNFTFSSMNHTFWQVVGVVKVQLVTSLTLALILKTIARTISVLNGNSYSTTNTKKVQNLMLKHIFMTLGQDNLCGSFQPLNLKWPPEFITTQGHKDMFERKILRSPLKNTVDLQWTSQSMSRLSSGPRRILSLVSFIPLLCSEVQPSDAPRGSNEPRRLSTILRRFKQTRWEKIMVGRQSSICWACTCWIS